MGAKSIPPDHGLVAPIAVPPDARVPDVRSGAATQGEYDRYFRIRRDDVGLLPWTRSCLEITDRVLADLDATELPAEDQRDILRGCMLALQVTLARWSEAATVPTNGDEPAATDGD